MLVELEKQMRAQGIDVFGTSHCGQAMPERFQDTPYAITLGVRLSGAVIDEVADGPTKLYFHHYRTVNARLDQCALLGAIALQRSGYRAVAIPASQTTNAGNFAGDFAHKTAANLAGLGFIGKSGLFVSHAYGPRVRLATVLTDLPVPAGEISASQCGDCMLCVRACPCGAITGAEWTPGAGRSDLIDAALCSHHMKTKYQSIGRGAVCGICVAVCPMGKPERL